MLHNRGGTGRGEWSHHKKQYMRGSRGWGGMLKCSSLKEGPTNGPGKAAELPPPRARRTQPDSLGLENLGCNCVHHSVLSTNLDCHLPTFTSLSSFLTLPFCGIFSHRIFPSAINLTANVTKSYRRSLVPLTRWAAK